MHVHTQMCKYANVFLNNIFKARYIDFCAVKFKTLSPDIFTSYSGDGN